MHAEPAQGCGIPVARDDGCPVISTYDNKLIDRDALCKVAERRAASTHSDVHSADPFASRCSRWAWRWFADWVKALPHDQIETNQHQGRQKNQSTLPQRPSPIRQDECTGCSDR